MSPTDSSKPIRISVIVASFNAAKTIERCIDSFARQTYPNRELIVMDGASKDDTVEILKNRTQDITYWESQKDRGIYHAFNKAVDRTTGDWICFLGADDYFPEPEALEK